MRVCLQVRQICGNEEMLNEYTQLFAQGYKSVDEVEAEFNEAFGESFQYIDPVGFSDRTAIINHCQCLYFARGPLSVAP